MNDITVGGGTDVGLLTVNSTHGTDPTLPSKDAANQIVGQQPMQVYVAGVYRGQDADRTIRNLTRNFFEDPTIFLPATYRAQSRDTFSKLEAAFGPDHPVVEFAQDLEACTRSTDERRSSSIMA